MATSESSALDEQVLQDMLAAALAEPGSGEKLAQIDSARIEADYAEAWQALHAGDMARATERFGALATRAPDQYRIQFGFALCLQHFGLIEDAGRHFSLAYVLDPSSASCAFRLGECLHAAGHFEAAREALLTAIQLCDVPGADPAIRQFAQDELDRLSL